MPIARLFLGMFHTIRSYRVSLLLPPSTKWRRVRSWTKSGRDGRGGGGEQPILRRRGRQSKLSTFSQARATYNKGHAWRGEREGDGQKKKKKIWLEGGSYQTKRARQPHCPCSFRGAGPSSDQQKPSRRVISPRLATSKSTRVFNPRRQEAFSTTCRAFSMASAFGTFSFHILRLGAISPLPSSHCLPTLFPFFSMAIIRKVADRTQLVDVD